MAQNRQARRAADSGVTLLEILVVLAIITMIATLAAPRLLESFGRAKSSVAEIRLSNVKAALQLFYLDVGRYPTETENLNALLKAPAGLNSWDGPYLEEKGLLDPWKRTVIYRSPGESGPFDLLTFRRDGQSGGTKEDKDIRL